MKWFIPGNVPSSKNSRQWTGKYFIVSKTVAKYRNSTKELFAKLAPEFRYVAEKYELPLHVTFKFIRGSKHKFDYLNPCQTTQDDMVKHEWLIDDNCVYIVPHFDPYEYDKDNPGVWIEIDKELNYKK